MINISDGKVEIQVTLDDSGVKAQVKKLDKDLSNLGKTMPKGFDKGATGVEKRARVMTGDVRNVLARSEKDALMSGQNFGKNLATPIGKTSEAIIKQYQRTGQGISQPLVTASYVGSTAFQNMEKRSSNAFNRFASAARTQAGNVVRAMDSIGPTVIRISDNIGSAVSRGITAPFQSAIGMVKQYGALIGVLSTGSLISAGVNRLSAIEDARIALGVMLGDAQKVDTFMDDVLAFAKTTPFAFPQLATAAKNMVAFGMDTQKVVPTLKAIGDAAAASGKGAEGLDMITAAFGDMQLSGKLSLDQVNRLTANGVNALAILANKSGISIDDMRKKISDGAVGSKEAIDQLVDGIQNGTKGIAGETKAMGGVMEQMKDSWRGSVDSLKSSISSTMATIMTPAMPHIRNFMKWFGDQFKRLPGVVDDIVNAVKPAFEALLPVFKSVSSAIKGQIIPAIIAILPIFEPVAKIFLAAFILIGETLANIVGPAFEFIGNLIKENTEIFKLLVSIVTAVVAGLFLFGQTVKAIEGVTKAIKVVRAAWVLLNTTILANPILAVIAAIIAVAILVYIYWDPIKAFFIKLWDAIKESGLAIWDVMKGAWTSTVDWLKNIWSSLVGFFKEWGLLILGVITGPIGLAVALIITYWKPIKDFFINLWESIKEVWQTSVNFLIEIFSPMIDFFFNLWSTISTTAVSIFQVFTDTLSTVWSSIETIAGAAWEIIKNVILGPILLLINLVTGDFKGFASNLSQIQENIRAAASRIWGALKTGVIAVITGLVKVGASLFNAYKTTISGIFTAISSTAKNIWNALKNAVVTIITTLVSTGKSIFDSLKSAVISIVTSLVTGMLKVWNSLKTKTADIFKSVVNFIKNPLKAINLASIGKDIIQGLINGIKSKIAAVGNAVKDVTSAITGKIKNILKIASPSKITFEMGEWTGEGLEDGLTKSAKGVAKAAGIVAESAMPVMPSVSGLVNRLRGVTAPVGNVMPVSAVSGSSGGSGLSDNGSGNLVALLSEQNKILSKILGKNQDLYIDGEKVTDIVNENNAISATVSQF